MSNKYFLEGIETCLRPLVLSDISEEYIGWLNDDEVCKYNSHHVYVYDEFKAEEYIKNISLSRGLLILAIVDRKNEKHIGNVSLQHIDLLNRSAEFAILLGDKNYWGKGIAKEVAKMIIAHGFSALNLHRVYCGTSDENIAMQKLATYLGMSEEGRRREAQYKNGKYNDIIEYGILRDDFLSKHSTQ